MIPAGAGRHRDHFRIPDLSAARCTSSRVTWGGGDCLDIAGDLVRGCPRHQPNTYVQHARHKVGRYTADHLASERRIQAMGASWAGILGEAGLILQPWQERVALHFLTAPGEDARLD